MPLEVTPKMLPERIIESVRAATADVFKTMLNLDVVEADAGVDPSATNMTDGVVSVIGLAGDWVGTGVLQCDADLACTLFSHLLMTPATEGVTADVLDAVAEITNMIIGAVKNDIEEELGPMGMSIPTVIFGRNFTTRNATTQGWTTVTFHCEGSDLHIRISLELHQGRAGRAPFSVGHAVAG